MRNSKSNVIEPLKYSQSSLGIMMSCYTFSWLVIQPNSCVLFNWCVNTTLCRNLDKVLVCNLSILVDHFSINSNHALLDQLFSHSSRAYPHSCKTLSYPLWFSKFFSISNIDELIYIIFLLALFLLNSSIFFLSHVTCYEIFVKSIKCLEPSFMLCNCYFFSYWI